MATIEAAINLSDGMSSPVQEMIQATSLLTSRMREVQLVSREMIDVGSLSSGFSVLSDSIADVSDQMDEGTSAANLFWGSVKKVIGESLSLDNLKGVLGLADQMVQTSEGLDRINDGLQTTDQLNEMVYASAQRSRTEYMGTAAMISQFGGTVGPSFGSSEEIVAFTEQLSKRFALAGVSAEGMNDSIAELATGLSDGVLSGEELNSAFGAAPGIIQSIADYLGTDIERLQEMAVAGGIASDVIKGALFSTMDETNRQFQSMPMTFSQIWTSFSNAALMAFRPVLMGLSQLANGSGFQMVVAGLINGIAVLGQIAVAVFAVMISAAEFLISNWSVIGPILLGVAAALMVLNGQTVLSNLLTEESTLARISHAVALAKEAVAANIQTFRMMGLNAAMRQCPLLWVIGAVMLLVGAFYAVITAINKVTGSSYSAAGIICGALLTAAAFVVNLVIGVVNGIIQIIWSIFVEPFLGIIEWILNAANGGFDSFGGAVANLIGQVISWFLSLAKVVAKVIDAIFGQNWTDELSKLQDRVLSWGKTEDAITLDHTAPVLEGRFEYGKAWELGNQAPEKLKNMLEMDHSFELSSGDDIEEKLNGANSFSAPGNGAMIENLGAISDNTRQTAENTQTTLEDLQYLRDIAERDAVNRFTTAEVKLDFSATATVSSQMDLDGMINQINEQLQSGLVSAAEGVHQ